MSDGIYFRIVRLKSMLELLLLLLTTAAIAIIITATVGIIKKIQNQKDLE